MTRVFPFVVCGLWAVSLGCDDRTGTGQIQSRTTPTPTELVTAWAGPTVRIARFQPVEAPGFELFWLTSDSEQGRPSSFGVAIPIDEQNFLEGRGAIRALIQSGVNDATELAFLSMLFLERGGDPLLGPGKDLHRELGVTPPIIDSGTLTYWYERGSWSFVELLRSRLTLGTLDLSTESIHLAEHNRDRH